VKRIFFKLEVNTRAQAVSRAGTQGLLRTGKSWS
jgi:DNA-binding CsgD family transcriptional regulator